MSSSVDCEIYQVPLDEGEEEVQVLKPLKARTKKVLTEEQKQKCRENLLKATQRKKELAAERKAKLNEELAALKEPKVRKTKKAPKKPAEESEEEQPRKSKKPVRRSKYESESEEESEDYVSEEEEPVPPKKRSQTVKAPKKPSVKDMRLAQLEKKLDEIISNTKKVSLKSSSIVLPKAEDKPLPPKKGGTYIPFFD